MQKLCEVCETDITERASKRGWIRYCSNDCARIAESTRRGRSSMKEGRACQHCGNNIPASKQSSAKFCSQACRRAASQEAYRNQYASPTATLGLSSAVVAATSEIAVARDLMLKGWDVYRAVAWTAKCDLVAIKGNITLRVEVRTASRLHASPKLSATREGAHDILAFVWGDSIEYDPPLQDLETDNLSKAS